MSANVYLFVNSNNNAYVHTLYNCNIALDMHSVYSEWLVVALQLCLQFYFNFICKICDHRFSVFL